MSNALNRLKAALHASNDKRVVDVKELAEFSCLRRSAYEIESMFEQGGYMPPPQEKRKEALRKFRLADLPLTSLEWRLVFSGLSDVVDNNPPVLDEDAVFQKLHVEVKSQIDSNRLSRKSWLSLCSSYFSYLHPTPQSNKNWVTLQSDINSGFTAISNKQKYEKQWVRIVNRYREVFTENAGKQLGDQMFRGQISDLSTLQTIAQISENSWVWQRIFSFMLLRIREIKDEEFHERIERLLALVEKYPYYSDQLLAACLSRYESSKYRDTPHFELKQISLEKWGSPQLHSNKNSWSQYVDNDVCAMVIRWFAKEDLEHFFNLLQGDQGVDQARLDYWMRFVNQINYTRIVMGSDAHRNRSKDFVEFREKNRLRISELVGGPSDNNAVIMQIGEYFFVEFSGVGNACYVYHSKKLPFNPDRKTLELNALKQQVAAKERILHMRGWEVKADDLLRGLGIFPDAGRQGGKKNSKSNYSPSNRSGSNAPRSERDAAANAAKLLKGIHYTVDDRRGVGGAYWIKLSKPDETLSLELRRLGFSQADQHRYWIK